MESQEMPERADGVREAASDEAKITTLAEAAELWPKMTQQSKADEGASASASASAGAAPPGRSGFLDAYYHFVAPEDLVPAGPGRAASTAARHAMLGAIRPQGRAVVEVRDGGDASLTGASTVVDIVTDDMPYLVDSLTMELNRHSADVRLIVHPLLIVHRDVAGAIRGAIRPRGIDDSGENGAVQESWIHVELSHVADQRTLGADLRRVLDDVRVAYEDQRRMRSAARELVTVLADFGGPKEAEASELLAWLSAGHFTFLGFREYEFAGQQRKPVPGTGLGILRHDAPDEDQAMPQLTGAKLSLLGLAKSSTMSTVYRPSYLDYVGLRKFDPETGEATGEFRFLGLYTQAAYTESITRIP
ncbi:MAG: hypothetical protein ACRDN0_36620, partial [Trebonia sp.]